MDSNVDFEENGILELKKSTSELKEAIISIAAILNKHQKGELYFGIKNDGSVVGQDTSEKTSEKIILVVKENPSISAKEIAEKLGVSSRAIEMHIAKLKKNNIITRIGPAKGGHWAVVGK